MPKHRGRFVFVLLAASAVALSSPRLSAQERNAAQPAQARVMLEFSSPDAGSTAAYADSLASALIQSSAVLTLVRAGEGEGSLTEKAARNACPLAVQVSLALMSDASRLDWKIYAAPGGEVVDEGGADKALPETRELSTTYWAEVVSALEHAVSALQTSVSFITIVAAPKTVVRGIGEDIVVPPSGSIDIPLVLPADLVWSADSAGAQKESGRMQVEKSGASLVIPRRPIKPASPWYMDASAFGLAFPELSGRYELSSRLFLRATFTQYLFGLALVGWSSPSTPPSLFANFGMIQPGMGVGYIFSPPAAPLRLYAAFDLFARIQTPSGESASFDPVAPMGTDLFLGFDWGRSAGVRLFSELGLAFFPWAYPGLMLASSNGLGMQRIAFGGTGWFSGHPGWFAEFPVPRIGLRMRL